MSDRTLSPKVLLDLPELGLLYDLDKSCQNYNIESRFHIRKGFNHSETLKVNYFSDRLEFKGSSRVCRCVSSRVKLPSCVDVMY